MITCSNIPFPLDAGLPENQELLRASVAKALGVSATEVGQLQLTKRSVDARKKTNVHFVGTFAVALPEAEEERLLNKPPKGIGVKPYKPYEPLVCPLVQVPDGKPAPVVVGAGPAGLFAALYLARCGLYPVVLERGAAVEQRQAKVDEFLRTGKLDPRTNVQFGEGGAGTFSDGKLTTNAKNRFTQHVLRWFVEAGAPEQILWQAHPHVGSDNLPAVVRTMREEIIERGGQVLFGAQLTGVHFEGGTLAGITYKQEGATHTLATQQMVLACGHSARDTFRMLQQQGLAMERKPFAVGVRIEHPQALINEAQWGAAAHHPALGAAEYKLVHHLENGHSVYTFCMCPGGEVVAAASEEGGVVTNGMSNFARNGANANAALLVSVAPENLPGEDVFAGVELQQQMERDAYQLALRHGGTPYQAPAQTIGAFLTQAEEGASASTLPIQETFCAPTYGRGVVEAPLCECLPKFVTGSLAQALPELGRKLSGFDHSQAILTAPESRSSSPIRICRNANLQAYFGKSAQTGQEPQGCGIYPCGEGPGYAGGIMSAACDGLRIAEQLAASFK